MFKFLCQFWWMGGWMDGLMGVLVGEWIGVKFGLWAMFNAVRQKSAFH